jgi:hypothetical protein
MKGIIVTTTINPPTPAVRLYDALSEWHLVVVGDLRTPRDYHLDNGTYLSPGDQNAMDAQLSDLIGWNCIQRRNFGFVLAWRLGAEVIATVDDDNVPLPSWGRDLYIGSDTPVTIYDTDLPAFDPIGATNYPHLWHRGYPLQLLPSRDYTKAARRTLQADVQADFWNGDPDVDALCRMQFAPWCEFSMESFPMASTAMGPFDSQNTFIARHCLPNYFMFPHIGRMDDIWASYHLQAQGAQVIYGAPSVRQDRNQHDPISDLRAEYLGYEHNLGLVEGLRLDPTTLVRRLPERSRAAFERYRALL